MIAEKMSLSTINESVLIPFRFDRFLMIRVAFVLMCVGIVTCCTALLSDALVQLFLLCQRNDTSSAEKLANSQLFDWAGVVVCVFMTLIVHSWVSETRRNSSKVWSQDMIGANHGVVLYQVSVP